MTVWDLPLRLFHCLLVLAIVIAYASASLGGLWLEQHESVGVFILSLIVFRFVWGFVGSATSRFGQFFPTPRRIKSFLSSTWSGVGHSPLGAMSVFIMLGLVFLQTCLGLFAFEEDAEFHGPLYDLVSADLSDRLTVWHGDVFNVLLFFIVLHLCAIVYYAFIKKRNAIGPMITGKPGGVAGCRCTLSGLQAQFSLDRKSLPFVFSVSVAGMVAWFIESGMLVDLVAEVLFPVGDSRSTKTFSPKW